MSSWEWYFVTMCGGVISSISLHSTHTCHAFKICGMFFHTFDSECGIVTVVYTSSIDNLSRFATISASVKILHLYNSKSSCERHKYKSSV